jgi:hypothetical protein
MEHVRNLKSGSASDGPTFPVIATSFFNRHGSTLHLAACLVLLALFIAAARFLTLEADEANILLSAYNAFGIPLPQDSAAVFPTVTSGGVYPLIHGLIGMVTTNVGVHRAVSILLSVILVGAVFRLLRGMKVSPPLAMAGTAMFAATPGFLLVGSAAMAEIMAAILLLAGLVQWVKTGRRSIVGALACGLLFGLACATRFNAVFVLPAILLYALDFEPGWRRKLLYPGLCVATGVLVFILATQTYLLVGAAPALAAQADMGAVTGASSGKTLLHFARYLLIANDWLPLWVIVGASGLYLAVGRRILRRRDRQLTALLLLGGTIGWIMWVFRAPIPHVRYLWPALPCLWLGGIIVATSLVERTRSQPARTWLHVAALVTCFYQALTNFYLVAQGDSLLTSYQLNRISPLLNRGPNWTAADDQRAFADAVRSLPPSAALYTINRNAAFPITYYSGRTVEPLVGARFNGTPVYILALPVDFAIWRPLREQVAWRERYTTSVWRRGDYALFRVHGQAPPPPPAVGQIGANDIYPAP